MRDATIARSYAEALLELGERHQAHEAFGSAFQELAGLLEREPAVRTFLDSPRVDAAEKKAALERALSGRVPRLFLNFVLVVVDKRRQRLLTDIAQEYDTLLDEHSGRVHVRVTLAREPDERMEEDLQADLARLLGRNVIAHVQVDPRIIGGLIVRWGDRVLDGSLRRRLAGMRRQMLEAELPAR